MMSCVKFSILIPAYKKAFLKDAINSCLSQTVKNLEVIIVDDCSPEDLGTIVAGFDDERIHYYRNESNIGALNVVDNWNKCLSLCTGDYVICMGDDDMLLPDCLEEYMDDEEDDDYRYRSNYRKEDYDEMNERRGGGRYSYRRGRM